MRINFEFVLICDINNKTVNSQLLSNLNGGIHIFLHKWADKCVFVSNNFSFIFNVTIKIIIEKSREDVIVFLAIQENN